MPFPQVEWLRAAGFGRIRVPAEDGGLGATLPQFFRQLVALGRADSNLPQLLRGHIGFVESRLGHADPDVRKRWLRRIVDGALVGNAQSEDGSPSFWQNATTVRRDGHGLAARRAQVLLDGLAVRRLDPHHREHRQREQRNGPRTHGRARGAP